MIAAWLLAQKLQEKPYQTVYYQDDDGDLHDVGMRVESRGSMIVLMSARQERRGE
jgi:hypothetical protein